MLLNIVAFIYVRLLIVFIADALEPNRGNTPELEKMRQVSWQNLYKSVQQTCEYSLEYLIKQNKTIHPRAILTRNWALQRVKVNS